ncbi:hypothetical protein BDR03DRAFT_955419 [Suillus americanus]|nr:hypothetical protein BDR03DRAFT_955419 [Suillus americanus]
MTSALGITPPGNRLAISRPDITNLFSTHLLASLSSHQTPHSWKVPAGTEVARYQHSEEMDQVAFSLDGRSIFSGGYDKKTSQWEIVPEQILTTACGDSQAEMKSGANKRV